MKPIVKPIFVSLCFALLAGGCNSDKLKSKELAGKKMLEIRADYLFENNRFKELIPILDSLIGLDSLNGKFYFQRAFSNGRLINRDAAVSDFLTAIKLEYRVSDSYYNAGIYCSFTNDSLALYYFRRAVEKNPNNINAVWEIEECKNRLEVNKERTL